MFTINNGQAGAFNSPAIGKLFAAEDRQFPVDDAFRLADIIRQIHEKSSLYKDQTKKLVETNGGTIANDGRVRYKSKDDATIVQQELDKLNAVELELTGTKVKPTSAWPKLTLAEATILRPILNLNSGNSDDVS